VNHGRAVSSCAASCSSRSSSPKRAMNCTPSGSPSAVQCRGTLIAGVPVRLASCVNGTYCSCRVQSCRPCPRANRRAPTAQAGPPDRAGSASPAPQASGRPGHGGSADAPASASAAGRNGRENAQAPWQFIPLQQLRGQGRGRGRAAERRQHRVRSSKSDVRAPAARACATMAGTCPK